MADDNNRVGLARPSLVLVTGGAGFIGAHLVDRLLWDGVRVRVLDDLSSGFQGNVDSRAELVRGDVADVETVRAAMSGVGATFHLAAIASVARGNEEWFATNRVNQSGTIAVLETARKAGGAPVVYASSAAVYGDAGDEPAREDRRPNPATAYGADKLGSELHARIGSHVHGLPTLGLRFFNVYGPRQDPSSPYSGVISIFADRLGRGEPVVLHGDGEQTRDFVHVTDVVAHLLAAMDKLRSVPSLAGSVLNVCTGRTVTIRALAHELGRLQQRTPAFLHEPARAGDIRHSRGNPDAAIAALGVAAGITLEDGLASLPRSYTR